MLGRVCGGRVCASAARGPVRGPVRALVPHARAPAREERLPAAVERAACPQDAAFDP